MTAAGAASIDDRSRGIRARLSAWVDGRAWPYLFLVPALLLVAVAILYPLASGILLSFHNAELLRPARNGFVGLDNFAELLDDPVAWTALVNTLVWVGGGVLIQLAVGLGIALLLDGRYRGVGPVRVLVFLPWFLPSVVVAHMWAMMLDARFGVINDILARIGLIDTQRSWFADPATALLTVMVVELWWSVPFFALFLLAGMQSIPDDLVDATRVDGASGLQRLRYLTLPFIQPVIVVAVVLQVIRLTNAPDLLNILTGGGPGRASMTLSLYAYRTAYQKFDFGYAAAISVVLLIGLSIFAVVYIRRSGAVDV
ncbi:MAG: sugar ABC transporter permease [Chloroflexi bacterium]|nr:sugar ABC transporter permease [Chloroflexota bacterium]